MRLASARPANEHQVVRSVQERHGMQLPNQCLLHTGLRKVEAVQIPMGREARRRHLIGNRAYFAFGCLIHENVDCNNSYCIGAGAVLRRGQRGGLPERRGCRRSSRARSRPSRSARCGGWLRHRPPSHIQTGPASRSPGPAIRSDCPADFGVGNDYGAIAEKVACRTDTVEFCQHTAGFSQRRPA